MKMRLRKKPVPRVYMQTGGMIGGDGINRSILPIREGGMIGNYGINRSILKPKNTSLKARMVAQDVIAMRKGFGRQYSPQQRIITSQRGGQIFSNSEMKRLGVSYPRPGYVKPDFSFSPSQIGYGKVRDRNKPPKRLKRRYSDEKSATRTTLQLMRKGGEKGNNCADMFEELLKGAKLLTQSERRANLAAEKREKEKVKEERMERVMRKIMSEQRRLANSTVMHPGYPF